MDLLSAKAVGGEPLPGAEESVGGAGHAREGVRVVGIAQQAHMGLPGFSHCIIPQATLQATAI